MPELTLEQQFSIKSFESQVQQMSHEQAQNCLKSMYSQMVEREAGYKELLKHRWFGEAPGLELPG